ncbi:MAG TPA: hypothetical protein VMT23_00725 [Candidatus Binatia bacterium]|nr:hypothetical protein [Candidatus Binatia bacterium]
MSKKAIAIIAVGCVVAVVAITSAVESSLRSIGRPSIALVNTCQAVDNGGTLTLKSSNFTPGGNYNTVVTLNGKFYFNSWGLADDAGHLSSWRWPCDRDTRPGDYRIVVLDGDKQRLSNELKFNVPKPPTDTGSTA